MNPRNPTAIKRHTLRETHPQRKNAFVLRSSSLNNNNVRVWPKSKRLGKTLRRRLNKLQTWLSVSWK